MTFKNSLRFQSFHTNIRFSIQYEVHFLTPFFLHCNIFLFHLLFAEAKITFFPHLSVSIFFAPWVCVCFLFTRHVLSVTIRVRHLVLSHSKNLNHLKCAAVVNCTSFNATIVRFYAFQNVVKMYIFFIFIFLAVLILEHSICLTAVDELKTFVSFQILNETNRIVCVSRIDRCMGNRFTK